MGPRQITGVSSGTKWPIEITFTPWDSSGMIMLSNPTGLPSAPIIRGTLKPHTSASRIPTFAPSSASTHARFTVTLDFPTPPFPDAIANSPERFADLLFGGHRRSSPGYDSTYMHGAYRANAVSLRRGSPHAGTARDRGAQGPRGGHAVPPLPVPAAIGAPGRRPRAGHPPVPASEHAPAAPAPSGRGRARRTGDPPDAGGRRPPPDPVRGGRRRAARGQRSQAARRHPVR